MSELKRTLLAVLLCAVGVGVVSVPAALADEPKVKKPQPTAEPTKPIIIQIDASKLPPEVLKELLKLSQAEPTKPVIKPGTEPTKPGVKPEPTKPVIKPGTEPTKPGVKPEPTKPGTKPEPTKPGVKPGKTISLSDAIAIAEKLTKGTVVKAERGDKDGTVFFVLDVLDGKNSTTKVVLDGTGDVIKRDNTGDDKEEKGKKKIK